MADEARSIEARFETERAAARASLVAVNADDWWEQAQPKDIADVLETATIWKNYDDVALEAASTIRAQALERYGVDVDAPGADPVAVAIALQEEQGLRAAAARAQYESDVDLTAAQRLVELAESHEQEGQRWADHDWSEADGADQVEVGAWGTTDSELKSTPDGDTYGVSLLEYDSAERRAALARGLSGQADGKAVDARLLADGDQARHPREAVLAGGAAPKGRKASTGVGQTRERDGLSR